MKRSSAASSSTLPPSGDGVDASDTDDLSTVPSSGDEVDIQPKLGGRKKGIKSLSFSHFTNLEIKIVA